MFILVSISSCNWQSEDKTSMEQFSTPISYEEADLRACEILKQMTLNEKIQLVGGHDLFFIKGYPQYGIEQFYLSDATQGVHLRKDLDSLLEKSTAFPCPIALTATWNTDLARDYARSIGEECRAGNIAVLLGPGINIYRISQNGRNFEYFGEDPYLASRMVENYVSALQNTGTIATLKHFVCNNTDFRRRVSNSIVDERTLHEIYLPAFKAGIDAGAMAVMTSYNQLNGEWSAQNPYLIKEILRKDLGFRWLVMSDWWSTFDPVKSIKSGLDLEMPGEAIERIPALGKLGDVYVKSNAQQLIDDGKVEPGDIDRMARSIIRTCIAMGLYERPVKDDSYLDNYPQHAEVALQTARESMVLLKNSGGILPVSPESNKKILLTGEYVTRLAAGGGSAAVEGYDHVMMLDALKEIYKDNLIYAEDPTDEQIATADIVLLSIGTDDHEGWDMPFEFPDSVDRKIFHYAQLNENIVVLINSGGGRRMTQWNDQVAAILYCWYPGQNGNKALAEIISGATNPSGKLPITIEKQFQDSPGYRYIPDGEELYTGDEEDWDLWHPIIDIHYDEGIFVGYRWYEKKNIEPLYHFGHGLSYTTFAYEELEVARDNFIYRVRIKVKNTGKLYGKEIVQLYVSDMESSVARPVKELKGFSKVDLEPGESRWVEYTLQRDDFAFWDTQTHGWKVEPGEFRIKVGSSSRDIRAETSIYWE